MHRFKIRGNGFLYIKRYLAAGNFFSQKSRNKVVIGSFHPHDFPLFFLINKEAFAFKSLFNSSIVFKSHPSLFNKSEPSDFYENYKNRNLQNDLLYSPPLLQEALSLYLN